MKCQNFLISILLVLMLSTAPIENVTLGNAIELLLRKYDTRSTGEDHSYFMEKPLLAEYDFIVIGSGPGGSVVANRLTEVPHWNVLLLEAGKEETVLLEVPGLVNYFTLTDYNWNFQAEQQSRACLVSESKRCKIRLGKSLGGTTSINNMIYTRGDKNDYDEWAEMGNVGWSYNETLPYFIKMEQFMIPEEENYSLHGHDGPLNVENVPYSTELGKAFLAAGKEMGNNIIDYNSGEVQTGFSKVQVTMRKGRRFSAAKSYLRPIKNRWNLYISLKSRVTKILIDPANNNAYGVKVVKNRKTYTVLARKEVILAAGAAGSPKLLMLSGIGPKDHLNELHIPLIKDLRVGGNLQQQVAYFGLTFLVNETYVGLLESRVNNPNQLLKFFNREATGPLNVPGGIEGLAYFSTEINDDEKGRPDIELIFASSSLASDGALRGTLGVKKEVYNKVFRPIEGRDSWTIYPMILRPKSRGCLKLKSKNPWNSPILFSNYFQNSMDLDAIVEGIKFALNISKTDAFQKYGSYLNLLPIPGCEPHTPNSDDYWICAVQHMTMTVEQLVGTCKMGPDTDPDAVVSPELKVHGIKKLRIVDESIIPIMVSGHVTGPAYMIGEKASDLIKDTWFTEYDREHFGSKRIAKQNDCSEKLFQTDFAK